MMLYLNLLLSWWLILFMLATLQATDQEDDFMFLYGGIVGQDLGNTSSEDKDVLPAVELAVSVLESSLHNYCLEAGGQPLVKYLRKTRLYYSDDDVKPSIFLQHLIVGNKAYVQRIQMVLGLLYTFVLVPPACPELEYKFTVTRDRNKQYHMCQYTHGYTCVTQEGGELKVGQTCKQFQSYKQTSEHSASEELCGQSTEQSCRQSTEQSCRQSTEQSCGQSTEESCGQTTEESCGQTSEQSFIQSCNISTRQSCGQSYTDRNNMFSVATYNIWNLNNLPGEVYEDRLERLGKLISSQNIDVFGFQEVRVEVSDQTQNQISHLSHYLPGYQYVYQPAMLHMKKAFMRMEEGLAIFSRFPILTSDYILLYRNVSDVEDRHQRICLHAEVLTPAGSRVHVFVTHLSLSTESRERSVMQISKYMSQFSGVKLLMGDFNDEPHSNAIRFLTGEVSLEGVYYQGLRDAWSLVNTEDLNPGYTFSALQRPHQLVKRIDYIFIHQSPKSVEEVHIVNTSLLDSNSSCYEGCSDHLGVVTTMITGCRTCK